MHAFVLFILPMLFVSCAPDLSDRIDPSAPRALESSAREVMLDALWPNTDGSYWRYESVYHDWFSWPADWTYYPDEQSLPAAPTPAEVLKRYLGHQPTPREGDFSRFTYGLTFDGWITTQSGVTAQHLVESSGPVGGKQLARPATEGGGTAFLASLYRARPDLRAALLREHPDLPRLLHYPGGPHILFGYAWAKTSECIGSYGDLDQDLSWKYLTSDLALGATFDHQLVKALTDDVWLHGMISRRLDARLPNGDQAPAVECLYVIDYGASVMVDEQGNELGYFRLFDFGTVVYAAGVGPIACYQRGLLEAGDLSDPGMEDWRLTLREYQIAE